jgi:hypothetical protein
MRKRGNQKYTKEKKERGGKAVPLGRVFIAFSGRDSIKLDYKIRTCER